jgi:nitroreductase
MNIIEAIKIRKSCRTFEQTELTASDKNELEKYILENKKPIVDEIINLGIVEKKNETRKMKLDYGMIRGHHTYLLGVSKSTVDSRINYGYLMEKVVLKTTELGISTCWIGIFDETYFNEIILENGYEIPSIVIVGYSNEKLTNLDKLLRFSVNASKRLDWEKLFFHYYSQMPLRPEMISKYAESLEMVRLAPSAGNTQPWRIFFDDTTNEFHFFKKPINKNYEEKGLHDIDLGITMAHFELTSHYNNLSGSWMKHSNAKINSTDDLQYMMTWKCN